MGLWINRVALIAEFLLNIVLGKITEFHGSEDAAFRILASGHAKPRENGISDVAGFMDGTERYGLVHCRRNAWSDAHFLDQEKDVMPLVCAVDDVFREEMPGRHAAQLAEVMKTHPAWRLKIKRKTTAFTTLTSTRTCERSLAQMKAPEGRARRWTLSGGDQNETETRIISTELKQRSENSSQKGLRKKGPLRYGCKPKARQMGLMAT
jgi:hypothetical protein